jgi:hypothetical protein
MSETPHDIPADQGGGRDDQPQSARRARRAWVKPEVVQLPPLTDLTLQTLSPIVGGGGTGGGGGTVF